MIIDFFTGLPVSDPVDPEKPIHACTICGKNFNWDGNSGWYGSYKDAEEGGPIEKYCSDECALKSGHLTPP